MASQYRAWISRDLESDGIAWVVVARERQAGWCEVGAFLVDAWCLGVKDAYADEVPADEVDDLLEQQLPAAEREVIEPACARRLVEGAVAYAQALGFLPHRDHRKARKVFGSLKAADCGREFAFGDRGRVHFVAGPDDDDARVRRVLAVLDARLGPGGFDYTPAYDTDPDDGVDWDLVDTLHRFLDSPANPEPARTGWFLGGFLAAAVLIDAAREPAAWWAEFLGGRALELSDDCDFHAADVRAGFSEQLANTARLMEAGDFLPPLPEVDEPDHASAAEQYCRGALRVLEGRAALLAEVADRPAVDEGMSVLRRYAEPVGVELSDAVGRRSAGPVIAAALERLWVATAGLRGRAAS